MSLFTRIAAVLALVLPLTAYVAGSLLAAEPAPAQHAPIQLEDSPVVTPSGVVDPDPGTATPTDAPSPTATPTPTTSPEPTRTPTPKPTRRTDPPDVIRPTPIDPDDDDYDDLDDDDDDDDDTRTRG